MVETWVPWRVWGVVMVTAGLVALVALRAAGGPARHPRPHLPGRGVHGARGRVHRRDRRPRPVVGLGMAPVFLLVAAGHAVPVILHASNRSPMPTIDNWIGPGAGALTATVLALSRIPRCITA